VTVVATRAAAPSDAPRLAQLHVERISEGFLAQLGPSFLTRLYRRMIRSPQAFVVVAEDAGVVVAFCSAAQDVKRFYREFLLHDGVVAGLSAAPRILRTLPRVMETLRYPATTGDLPAAEILSVVTDERAAGRGLGSAVLQQALAELRTRGCPAAKVVVGSNNAAALRMYRRGGFDHRARISVHDDVSSEVLVWASS
jgi:ribosomal protein S18 acetylase RimI-like enzyme